MPDIEKIPTAHGDIDVDKRFFEEGPDKDKTVDFFALDRNAKLREWSKFLNTATETIQALTATREQLRETELAALPGPPEGEYQAFHLPVQFVDKSGRTRTFSVPQDEFEHGPRTKDNHPVDLQWSERCKTDATNKNDNERRKVWQAYLKATDGKIRGNRKVIYDKKMPDVMERLEVGDDDNPPLAPSNAGGNAPVNAGGNAGGVKVRGGNGGGNDKLCWAAMNPKATTGLVLGVLVLAGIGAGIAGGVGAYSRPEDVQAEPGVNDEGAFVSVSWTASNTHGSGDYVVSLIDTTTLVTYSATVSRSVTSGVYIGVVVGIPANATYAVSVKQGLGLEGTTVVIVPPRIPPAPPTPNQPSTKPASPTNVMIASDPLGTPTAPPSITVTWTAAVPTTANPAAITGYRVRLRNADTTVGDISTFVASSAVKATLTVTIAGPWTAVVTAANDANMGDEATSASQPFDPTTGVVAAPANLRFVPYNSAALNAASLVALWDPPATGNWVDSYDVVVTKAGSATPFASITVGAPITLIQVPNTPDGTYTFTVTAKSIGDTSTKAATSTSFALVAAKIPAGAFDWDLFFSTELRARWSAANSPTTLNEATIWSNVLDAVNDTSKTLGGPASLFDQFRLAVLLSGWIKDPVIPPTDLAAIADALCDAATPPFPKRPWEADKPYAGGTDALWVAAQGITDNRGLAYPLRYRMLAIERVLERYLGAGKRRAYDLTVVPPVVLTAPKTPGPVITANRVDVHVNGSILGVWFYRAAGEKTMSNTVFVWDTTGKVLGSHTATPTPDAAGWSYVAFTTPVTVTVPTGSSVQFVVGVFHPSGVYVRGSTDEGPQNLKGRSAGTSTLSIPADSPPTASNGLYDYLATPAFPTQAYGSSEFFITPEFDPS